MDKGDSQGQQGGSGGFRPGGLADLEAKSLCKDRKHWHFAGGNCHELYNRSLFKGHQLEHSHPSLILIKFTLCMYAFSGYSKTFSNITLSLFKMPGSIPVIMASAHIQIIDCGPVD